MTTLNGIYSTDDITINGLSSLDLDNLDIDSLIVNGNVDISGNLIISRINPSLIPSLGSTINLSQLFQNSYFDSILREMQIWNDTGTNAFVRFGLGLGIFYLDGNTTNISSTTLNLNSPTINYDGNVVDFDSIDTTFHDGTLTITNNNITLNNSNIIVGAINITPTEISYLDNVTSNIQTQLNARGVLASANDWTEQNIFRKGILPCRGTGTNAESDIQIGGNNQFSLRQATSANNIGIGALTLQGSTTIPSRNTGSRNIAIGQNCLQQLDAGNDNVFCGHQAGQLCGQNTVTPSKNIALGSFAMQNCVYPTNCIAIGHNSLKNITSGTSMIVMGEGAGNAYTFTGSSIIIGDGAIPTAFDNDVIAIGRQAGGLAGGTSSLNSTILIGYRAGYRLNTGASRNVYIGYECGQACTSGSFNFGLGFNTQYALTTAAQCVACGSEAQRFLTSGNFNTAYGFQSHYWNVTGASNTSIGHQAGVHTTNNLNFTLCLGASSQATISNECVLGGETAANQVFLTLPNKHRIACNQSPTGATINLTFRSNENIFITDNTTININLPAATGSFNIGAKFNLYRRASTVNTISINAPAGQSYAIATAYGAFFTGVTAPYSWLKGERYLTVVCINSTGTSWLIQSSGPETVTYDPATTTLLLARSTDYVGIAGTITYKKYYVSMVNATEITTAGTTLATPLYEYTKVNFAGGTITLPVSGDVEIGTILRFRKTGNLGSVITITPNTSQVIYGYNSATTVAVAVDIMPANITYGSVLYITTNVWAVLDRS